MRRPKLKIYFNAFQYAEPALPILELCPLTDDHKPTLQAIVNKMRPAWMSITVLQAGQPPRRYEARHGKILD